MTRSYLLHVPANFVPGSSALIIGLHALSGTGATFRTASQLSVTADREGFAVAYPYSTVAPAGNQSEWNIYFSGSFGSNPPDDVGFLRELIRTLQATINPDPKRIFVTGLSNGGQMSHRAGVEIADLVAAIGVVDGSLAWQDRLPGPLQIQNVPAANGPVPVIIFHGDQDAVINYCGGNLPSPQNTPVISSTDQAFNYWAGPSANNCATADTTASLCDAFAGNISAVIEKDATACTANAEVKFYRLEGGMHQWYNTPMNVPGQTPFNPDFNSTTGVTTNDVLWNFFKAHAKP